MLTNRAKTRHRSGYTLIEMVLSLTLLSIVMVSASSAMLFVAKAAPNDDSAASAVIRDTQVLALIAEDLAQAKYVIERTSTAITIVVPDRTGDKIPDRLRYAWSGTIGDPLTFQINHASSETLIDAAQTFSLGYNLETHVTEMPPPMIFGPEKLLVSRESTDSYSNEDVTTDDHFGQYAFPILSVGSIGFMPTCVEVYARANAPSDGVMQVELRDADLTSLGETVYADATVNEVGLNSSFGWQAIKLVQHQVMIPNGQGLGLTFAGVSGDGTVTRLSSATNLLGGLIESTDAGANWSPRLAASLNYRLYGQEIFLDTSGIDLTSQHVASIDLALQSSTNAPASKTTTMLLQSPELLDAFWEADFNVSPTLIDLDNDGVNDWTYGGGTAIPGGALKAGVWEAKSSISTAPVHAFDKPTTLHMRICAKNNSELTITGPLHIDSSGDVMPVTIVLRDVDPGGQELVFYNDLTKTRPYGIVPVTKDGWVDVKFLVMPEQDAVALWIDGRLIGSAQFERVPDLGVSGLTFAGQGAGTKYADIRVLVGGSSSWR